LAEGWRESGKTTLSDFTDSYFCTGRSTSDAGARPGIARMPSLFRPNIDMARGPLSICKFSRIRHRLMSLGNRFALDAVATQPPTIRKRMGSQTRRRTILSFAALAIYLQCASAEECDYKTCGALMARDGSVSWGVLGRRDYAPETKRACAELNACIRRTKNKPAGRTAGAPAAGLSSEPANKQVKNMRPPLTSAVRDISGDGIPNADRANHKPSPCFAVAEILVQVDCSPQ